jgi:hypothetical protein
MCDLRVVTKADRTSALIPLTSLPPLGEVTTQAGQKGSFLKQMAWIRRGAPGFFR